jgi:hypothetical protein
VRPPAHRDDTLGPEMPQVLFHNASNPEGTLGTAHSNSSLNAAGGGVLPRGSLLVVPRVAFAHPDPHHTTCKVASRPLPHQHKHAGVCLAAHHDARLSPSPPQHTPFTIRGSSDLPP